MTLLSPTANRRWNELIGLIWMGLALMLLMSLASFSPADRSFHTAAAAAVPVNWVGTVGAHSADLLYQLLGACSFLSPITLGWLGICWFRSRPVMDHWSKSCGATLFFFSLPAALALIPYSVQLYGLYPPGGVI